ncbi:MAG: DNA/RNA non-specific endonuclease [Bacteroidota bacterium]
MKRIHHVLLLLFGWTGVWGQSARDSTFIHRELPFVRPGDQVIRHLAYTLSYSEAHEQARWVAYELTAAETRGPEERASGFYEDPAVRTGSATNADYAGSGYDRGHLAPAGDMTWSETAMRESFYYSNMSPQVPAFNRGIWKKLETLVRAWAQEYDGVYVVTGPVLGPGLHSIGPENVSVPEWYYKVILDGRGTGWKAIGFLMANAASSAPLTSFAVPVDEVELRTGIDFFPALADDAEALVEGVVQLSDWDWKSTVGADTSPKPVVERMDSAPSHTGSVQCSGVTKKGLRCRNRTLHPSGRCHLHL